MKVSEDRAVSARGPVPCTPLLLAAGGRARESETTSLVPILCQILAPSRLERDS